MRVATFKPEQATQPDRRLSFVLFLTAGAITASVLLAEIVVRFSSSYFTPRTLKQQSLPYEAALFARAVFPRSEATAPGAGVSYFINKNGYRGAPFSFERPPGATRIVIYGGSAVFDMLMPEGKDWPHRVEAILRSRGFPQVEVINAGTFGHTAIDCFGRFYAEGHLLSPDFVVLYTAWNDIKLFRSSQPILRTLKPYGGNPLTDYQNGIDRFLSETSQLYVRLRRRYFLRQVSFHEEGLTADGDVGNSVSPVALRQYRLTIQSFADMARNIGAQPVLITEARLASRETTPEQRKRIAYHMQRMTHETLVEAYERIDEILQQVAREKSVAVIHAAREMSGGDRYFADQVHLSDSGSQTLAGLVAAYFEPLLAKAAAK